MAGGRLRDTMRNLARAARGRACGAGLLLGLSASIAGAQTSAEEFWNPFKWGQKPPAEIAPKDQPPPGRGATWQSGPRSGPVESSDLPPVLAREASGLPLELWRGLDLAALEKLVAALELPPRSPALHQLWRRMLLSSAAWPAGTRSADEFLVLRQDFLYRSGLLRDMGAMLDGTGASSRLVAVLRARVDIALGARERGCRAIEVLPPASIMPGRLKGEAQLLAGYCAAAAGNPAAASLAAGIAREEGVAADDVLALLSGIESRTARHALPERVSLLGYRLLEVLGPVDAGELVRKAEPALLAALAGTAAADARLRTSAAEAALRLNAVAPETVADVYRGTAEPAPAAAEHHGPAGALHRARLFRAVEAAPASETKAQLMRTLLEDARRAGIHMQTAQMLLPQFAHLWPSQDNAVLAETIAQVALAAGDFELARRWAESSASLQHWLALIDIADPTRRGGWESGLLHLDAMAAHGRLDAVLLHRLATVLAALDVNVPVGIWEAASRTPQPAGGHLPETGVLAELAQVSQLGNAGHTALLAMRALGARRADEAHMLALGDTVRALKRAGLEADARRLALEALFALWPRTSGH